MASKHLSRCRQVRHCDLVYNLVPPKILNQCITRLDVMEGTAGCRRFKQRPQLHETMAAAARIKRIEGNYVLFFSLKGSASVPGHGSNPALITAAFRGDIEAEQTATFAGHISFFHD